MKLKPILFISVICTAVILAIGLSSISANAATNAAFSLYDITDLGNPRFGEHLYHYTQSTASPEAFSVGMPELPGVLGWDYDEFDISYQTDASAGEWTEETVYTWVDTDADGYRDSLQATLTGADAASIVYVYARDIFGE